MAGGLSRGYWTRLHARAFFFEEGGRHLLLVSCDLYQIPEALSLEVAGRLAAKGIRPTEIVIAATHTHQGPGNFGSADVYNEFGSINMGFSRELFDFLARQITEASTEAIDSARGERGEVRLILRRGPGPDVFLNRAPAVFLLNTNRDNLMNTWNSDIPSDPLACQKRKKIGEPENNWAIAGCPRLRAIDRTITLLEVLRDGKLIGALIFFSLHPTVLHHEAALYSADFVGELVGTLERRWKGLEGSPIVGFFNGAEGDIVTRRTSRDILDVGRIAESLARSIQDLPQVNEGRLTLGLSYRKVVAARAACDDAQGEYHLATKPLFGVAAFGGGEGDRTVLYDLGWREGAVGPAKDGQGLKVGGLDSTVLRELRLTEDAAPSWKYPTSLTFTYGRLGPLTFLAVPFEMTTTVGWRVRETLAESGDARTVSVIGLANGYSSYLATREEYQAQEYVGASTVWGPEQSDVVVCLARRMQGTTSGLDDLVGRHVFLPGAPPEKAFGPGFLGEARQDPLEANSFLFMDETERPARSLPTFRWCERVPAGRRTKQEGDFKATQARHVRILERFGPDGWRPRMGSADVDADLGVDDDEGFNLVTVLMDGSKPGVRNWATVWLRPLRAEIDGSFRFEIEDPSGRIIQSSVFRCHLRSCESPPETVPCLSPTG